MTTLTVQQIMSSRFRTSAHADAKTKALMEGLALSTKANVARLAIGRSLAAGALPDDTVDAKGLEIPATSLFTQVDVTTWVGLLATHASIHGGGSFDSMDSFRTAVRRHWHRGASLLMNDWKDVNEDYDAFIGILLKRRSDLPDTRADNGVRALGDMVPAAATEDISKLLIKALSDIGVSADVKGVVHGPRVSRYKVLLRDVNQLDKLRKGLERLALALNLQNMMPTLGTSDEANTLALDIPRPRTTWINAGRKDLEAALDSIPRKDSTLEVFPGQGVTGQNVHFDLATAPHLLVGGATGQGKSVCMHVLIVSLITRHTPDTLKLCLIDPKQVEFAVYEGSKYLWNNEVASGVNQARNAIDALVIEMDSRYVQLKALGVNNVLDARRKAGGFPFIVAFIDELADLIIQDRTVESKIVRLAQAARAAGIHLVLATQRPDAKTFSGLIRSNIPSRIALTVQKSTESQIILDETGAEDLLGKGDMLIKRPGEELERAHGFFLSLTDVEAMI
ncbi:FtsK/SpoIIIE domain-containing protein [Mesorhizobium sp. M0195]|uniref:FtsK/SpoIIIE domain-containing protein n=1 Tax=Mesorhizobium sp. M0195 TaxID=2956910 RepID=UPI00333C814F